MIDINLIRQDPNRVKQAAIYKNRSVDVDRILILDAQLRSLQTQVQTLRTQRNELAKLGKTDPAAAREQGKKLKEEIAHLEEQVTTVDKELTNLMLMVPNIPLPEVPVGKDEHDNVIHRAWGEVQKPAFKYKDHIQLLNDLDLVEFERGTKISGFRGYFLKGKAVQLHMAIMMYAIQKLSAKGYTPLIAPALVKGFTLYGNGQFPWGKAEVYQTNEDEYLAGTAEVPVTALHADEVLSYKDLPKKFVAFSPCFRQEAGSYGKDTKGLYRVHEFWKIEQVILCKNDIEESKRMHEELQANTEEMWQELGIPYRVLLMCTGDMGEPQVKKYDTEVWIPGSARWAELASNSIMTDFQARRLNIRYKDEAGTMQYVHTLNNTAINSPRGLLAICEHYQQEDGSINVPEVLRPFCGFERIGK
jgi:seryl-tRNA synthetase